MKAIKIICRICGKPIRGHAAREDYDPTTQTNSYLCRACQEFFDSCDDGQA